MLNPVAMSASSRTPSPTRPNAPGPSACGMACSACRMALGPVLGGVLVGTVGWRGIFWVNIPVGLAAIVADRAVRARTQGAAGRAAPDPVGQVLVIVMLGLARPTRSSRAPARAGARRRSSASSRCRWPRSRCSLAYEPRRAEPHRRLSGSSAASRSPGANLSAICAIAAMVSFLFLSTLYLQDVRGLSALQAAA